MAREIFISYSRKDLEKVKAIKEEIEQATGAECWMDLEGIESGSPGFDEDIVNGIRNSRVFLFMLSAHSQTSQFAVNELELALKKSRESGGTKHVVMLNIDNAEMTDVFFLRYNRMNTIAWNMSAQREKLLRDLRRWTAKEARQEAMSDEEEFLLYKRGAEQHDLESMTNLAQMYESGRGVKQSIKEAYMHYRAAADKGYARAQYLLGYMLGHRSVYLDISREFPSARSAAHWCLIHAIYLLPEKNYEQAAEWLEKATAQGYNGAATQLEIMRRKQAEAHDAYQKALEENEKKISKLLGLE